jgi:hypothetical protein
VDDGLVYLRGVGEEAGEHVEVVGCVEVDLGDGAVDENERHHGLQQFEVVVVLLGEVEQVVGDLEELFEQRLLVAVEPDVFDEQLHEGEVVDEVGFDLLVVVEEVVEDVEAVAVYFSL